MTTHHAGWTIREVNSKHFIASYHGVSLNADNIDSLKNMINRRNYEIYLMRHSGERFIA